MLNIFFCIVNFFCVFSYHKHLCAKKAAAPAAAAAAAAAAILDSWLCIH